MRLLVISFDAVGDAAFEAMAADGRKHPNIARFMRESRYTGGVKTAFVSNTYPIHCTVATGKPPAEHGIASNHLPERVNGQWVWAQQARLIRARTVWDAAREKGLKTAAILWPVTCGAKIDINLPEAHLLKGQNRIIEQMRNGSVMFQLKAMAKYGQKLRGEQQPYLDYFAAAAAADALGQKPHLTLVHLICYDDFFHRFGTGEALAFAAKTLDRNLGRLLDAAGDASVLVFSDHAQLPVHTCVNLDGICGEGAFEQCGGSAFYKGSAAEAAKRAVSGEEWFNRFITSAEMAESGYATRAAFGVAAKPGFCFAENGAYKGNHGYPADYDGYRTFYALRGNGIAPERRHGGRVTDVTGIIAETLDLKM